MLKSIKMQTSVLLRKKSTAIVFFILVILVLINFYTNIKEFRGGDANTMIHPMRMLFLSDSFERNNVLFFQYFPLFVVVPSAFAYLCDKNSREIVFIQSRVGKKDYYIGKFVSCFIVTFLLYTIPFILEALLNCIAFPVESYGAVGIGSFFESDYIKHVNGYMWTTLWYFNSYLYTFLNILGIGFASAVLATFTLALSTFSIVKFKILLFIPVYALLYLMGTIEKIFKLDFTTSYYAYIGMFNSKQKSSLGLLLFLVTLIIITCIILFIDIRRDEIN